MAFGEDVPPVFGRRYHTTRNWCNITSSLKGKKQRAAKHILNEELLIRQRVMPATSLVRSVFVSFLLMAGPVGCARHSSDSATLNQQLLLAARKGDNTAVLKLIKKGANIEAKDHGGLTPLGLAADFGHADTVKLLLAKGADRVAGQASGGDVLVETARSGNFKKMQILLDMGTSLDTRQKALFVAAESEPLMLKEEATPEMVA